MEGKFMVQEVYNITGIGPVIVGQVTAGQISKGMSTTIEGVVHPLRNMESNHKAIQAANPGQNVGIVLGNLKKDKAMALKGSEITFIDDQSPQDQIQQSRKMKESKGLFSFITRWFER